MSNDPPGQPKPPTGTVAMSAQPEAPVPGAPPYLQQGAQAYPQQGYAQQQPYPQPYAEQQGPYAPYPQQQQGYSPYPQGPQQAYAPYPQAQQQQAYPQQGYAQQGYAQQQPYAEQQAYPQQQPYPQAPQQAYAPQAHAGHPYRHHESSDLLPCPECQQASDSIKKYQYVSLAIFLFVFLYWRRTTKVACASCIRKEILTKSAIAIGTAHIIWPILVLPWHLVLICMSYSKGHSSGVRELYAAAHNQAQ